MSSNLVEFLRARLDDEDERLDAVDFSAVPEAGMTDARREVEAKRDLILLYKEAWAAIGKGTVAVVAAAVVRRDTLHRAVAILAAAWSDHPDYRKEWDYREEWRP